MMSQQLWKTKEQPQRTLAPLSVPGASSAGSIRVVSGSGFRYVVPFPYRLHEMLSTVDEKHDSSIVSWLPDGKHFKVHDPRRFVETVIPSAFKQKSLKSFQRQLHLYGFQRVHEGVDKGAYYHEKFLRDDRDLCLSITRTKAPKRSRVASAVQKKAFVPKVSAFSPLANNAQPSVVNTMSSLSVPKANNMTAASVSPTMFDDTSPHARFIPENSISMRGPLHSSVSVDSSSSSSANDSQSSSSIPQQQQLNLPQQLEGSIAETCRWLIDAGVPMSAFDPVAIEDISHSTFSVPQIVPSTSPLNGGIPQQSTIIESGSNTCSPSNLNVAPIMDNTSNSAEIAMNSLLATGQTNDNFDPLSAFDDDPLLQLPMVDDSLWAL